MTSNVPVPRSYAQIVGDLLDPFLAKTGIPAVKIGSVILGLFESAGQSDLRGSQDIFGLLNARNLDTATGAALLLHAAEENTTKLPATYASGFVTIGDSRYVKVSTTLSQGMPAPIVGSTILYVTDGSQFPSGGGSVYLSRNTVNYEGPLVYTSCANSGSYWTITLAGGVHTTQYHNNGDSVILAQGGNRPIQANAVCSTAQSIVSSGVQYIVQNAVTLLDGEVTLSNVTVTCTTIGSSGNCIAGAINSWINLPFGTATAGATVSNPLPFTNGADIETDDQLRARIKLLKQSKSKATPTAITTDVIGTTATDENKTISSASFVSITGLTSTLYIDDGTGYEEKTAPTPYESIMQSALGGEDTFQLNNTPIAKAYLTSNSVAPFQLQEGSSISVTIGGIISEHTFALSDFRNIASASAYEVVASINGNPDITFSARTANSGTQVVLFAKADVNEDIQVVASTGIDANVALDFALNKVETLRLYKNDVPLYKDGLEAVITSTPQSTWGSMSSPMTLTLSVDGTPAVTYSVTDLDFATNTSFTTLSENNSLASWAAVFNALIPGITAEVGAGALVITSNAGPVSRAALVITGGTLLNGGNMFSSANGLTSHGASNDYTFNRNTGQLQLEAPLAMNDRLTAGSYSTCAFIQSASISPFTLASAANLWVAVDGKATLVPTTLTTSTSVIITTVAAGMAITCPTSTFSNVQIGDWIIIWDSAVNTANQGYWRVAQVASDGSYLIIENPLAVAQSSFNLATNGYAIVRTTGLIQQLVVSPATGYTANSLASALNEGLLSATVSTYQTNQLRITTNTAGSDGDIAVVAADTNGQLIGFPVGNYKASTESQLGTIESSHSELGTPAFISSINTVYESNKFLSPDNTTFGAMTSDMIVLMSQNLWTDANDSLIGAFKGYHSTFSPDPQMSYPNNIILNGVLPPETVNINDVLSFHKPFAIGPYDFLALTLDGDDTTKAFNVPMYRVCKSHNSSYTLPVTIDDNVSGSPAPIADSFGSGYNWVDYAVYMHARTISHPSDSTKSALWRFFRSGPEGNNFGVAYAYPPTASTPTAVNVLTNENVGIIQLPSGPARTGYTLRSTSYMGTGFATGTPNKLIFATGLSVSSAVASGTSVTATIALPAGMDAIGTMPGQVYLNGAIDVTIPAGVKNVTAFSPTTITWTETAPTAGSYSPTGVWITQGQSGGQTFNGGSIVAGDIINVNIAFGGSAQYLQPLEITAVDSSGCYLTTQTINTPTGTAGVFAWGKVNTPSNVSIYPIDSGNNTVTQLVAAVNALPNCALANNVVLGDGTGHVTLSTFDEFGGSPLFYVTKDGINWVSGTTYNAGPPDTTTFSFKNPLDTSLAGIPCDWQDEELRLVPITALSVAEYLNSPAVCGLYANATIEVSSSGTKLQITTDTIGSVGSVQVQGGTANAASANIIGSALDISGSMYVNIPNDNLSGFSGNNWVSLVNTLPNRKFSIGGTPTISINATTKTITSNSAMSIPVDTVTGKAWSFVKDGKFIVARYENGINANATPGIFTTSEEGGWLTVAAPTGNTFSPAVSSVNTGTFRIVRNSLENGITSVWYENSNAVEEVVACNIISYTYNSIMVGDLFVIGNAVFGSQNIGTYKVNSISEYSFTVAQAINAAGPVTLGATDISSNFIQEGAPTKLYKQITRVIPLGSSNAQLRFSTLLGYAGVNSNCGTLMVAEDKLAFPAGIYNGIDGYDYFTGLIAEANLVVYGDEADTATFPGVAAAGANINISGPLVRRIQVAVSVRLNSGAPEGDIENNVKSAIAKVINQTKLGKSIALSTIIAAAESISGVESVVLTSPAYNVSNDLISIQPYEKPMVLNLDTDILVTFIGD